MTIKTVLALIDGIADFRGWVLVIPAFLEFIFETTSRFLPHAILENIINKHIWIQFAVLKLISQTQNVKEHTILNHFEKKTTKVSVFEPTYSFEKYWWITERTVQKCQFLLYFIFAANCTQNDVDCGKIPSCGHWYHCENLLWCPKLNWITIMIFIFVFFLTAGNHLILWISLLLDLFLNFLVTWIGIPK